MSVDLSKMPGTIEKIMDILQHGFRNKRIEVSVNNPSFNLRRENDKLILQVVGFKIRAFVPLFPDPIITPEQIELSQEHVFIQAHGLPRFKIRLQTLIDRISDGR